MTDLIYKPAEDSFFFKEIIENNAQEFENKSVFEMGFGSGLLLEALKKLNPKKLIGAEINDEAIKQARKKKFNVIKSNLFSHVNGKFDVIIFNPPYLPEDENEDSDSKVATTGGKNGSEIINEFLKQAEKFLEKNGKIFLLTSSLTQEINWRNYRRKKLGERKLFFETLEVWKLENKRK